VTDWAGRAGCNIWMLCTCTTIPYRQHLMQ